MTADDDRRTIQETEDALALRMNVPKDEMLKRVARLNFLKVPASIVDTARAAAFLASDRAHDDRDRRQFDGRRRGRLRHCVWAN